jgi:prophage maintenance system killer protein
MKTQIFDDGNKRTAIIFANHYLISQAAGIIIIPEEKVSKFKKLLIAYYENRDNGEIMNFMKVKSIKTF